MITQKIFIMMSSTYSNIEIIKSSNDLTILQGDLIKEVESTISKLKYIVKEKGYFINKVSDNSIILYAKQGEISEFVSRWDILEIPPISK